MDILALDEFLDRFDSSLDGSDLGTNEYTLILGAGASRSAGIPTAGELEQVFCDIARYRKRSTINPGGESNWSFLFRVAFGPENEFDDDSILEEPREFISRIVSLGSREPNLTNLIAANLAALRIFPLIVTTNYDDLLLAGFWSLPPHIPYSEPHIIYHPSDRYRPIGFNYATPIVVKAHGHHTEYAVGIVDNEIKRLAPYVKRAIKRQPRPRVGYIVVGYSGGWDDGIMQAFNDRSLMDGQEVYWFFRGDESLKAIAESLTAIADKIWRTAKLYFVRCDDSDFLFLNLWYRASLAFMDNSLTAGELFCPLALQDRLAKDRSSVPSAWWTPERRQTPESITDPERRRLLQLDKLAIKVLPVLDQWDDWEKARLRDQCYPPHIRGRIRLSQGQPEVDASDDEDPPALISLRQVVPTRVSWGRRDRRLLRLAVHPDVDPVVAEQLLYAVGKFQ